MKRIRALERVPDLRTRLSDFNLAGDEAKRPAVFGILWRISAILVVFFSAGAGHVDAQERRPEGQFDCLIQPKMVLKLGTSVPGLLNEVLVDRGDVIKKGDVVARLESGVEQAAVLLAKARAENDATVRSSIAKLEFQRRKDERSKLLRKNDAVSVAVADEAETSARVAEQDVEEAKVNFALAGLELARANEVLKLRTIRSPIDGVVVERKLGPGEYAFDQAHLLTISQIDPLLVEVFVPLSQFGKIHVGASAEVLPEAPVGGRYTARVTVVDQVFDAASGTIGVRLELPNPNYALPAGLKCRVRFPGVG
ncbi:efflux RND transporter periplasmic adaptor subunit [Bradyrhizobium sp. CCBAU 53338]|nr:efflux RND transporter periplasmic adaptor subunit [Bradyrhizobium sp. CCBAU 53338]